MKERQEDKEVGKLRSEKSGRNMETNGCVKLISEGMVLLSAWQHTGQSSGLRNETDTLEEK